MNTTNLTLSALLLSASLATAEEVRVFKKIQLHDQFWSEGANFGDLNKDGKADLIAGPWWWEGPDFTKRHEYAPATQTFNLALGPQTSASRPRSSTAPGLQSLSQRATCAPAGARPIALSNAWMKIAMA